MNDDGGGDDARLNGYYILPQTEKFCLPTQSVVSVPVGQQQVLFQHLRYFEKENPGQLHLNLDQLVFSSFTNTPQTRYLLLF